VVVVGGRFSPNFAELFVLAPVAPLTALETLVTQTIKRAREMTVPYRNILPTWVNWSKRQVSAMISSIPMNGVLAVGALMRCLVARVTEPLTGGI
jgi:hypothetical protein